MDFVEPVTEDNDDSEVLLRVRRSGLQRRSGNSGAIGSTPWPLHRQQFR